MSRWPKRTEEERFWQKVRKGKSCWLWTGGSSRRGYGVFRTAAGMVTAHRYAFKLKTGLSPEQVNHTCDVRLCVRHLVAGTAASNSADMVSKGRSMFGERNPRSKLTRRQVEALRNLREQGEPLRTLARRFSVSITSASEIARGLRYAR